MIEHCRLPGRGVVAQLASLGKSRLRVIGVRRPLEILQVAGDAGRAGQVVVIVDVAIATLSRRHHVRSGEGKIYQRMVEVRRLPRHRAVALLAGLRKICRNVVGIARSLKVLQVAGHAGRAGQIVVIVDMTIRALPRRYSVRSR